MKRHVLGPTLALLLAAAAALLHARTAVAETRVSDAAGRREVSVTVYNGDFGLVREVRDAEVGAGRVALEFADVAARIQPETVHIRSLTGEKDLAVLEQNYRYDLLSPQTLLAKYVGRRVRVQRWNDVSGRDESFDAEVLAANEGVVLRIGDEITYDFPGRISFPEVPDNLIAEPTLVWLLDSRTPKQRLEVSYLTGGLDWQADYVLVIDAADAHADLTGWVTLRNQSGASWKDAKLKLVAGDVQRIAPEARQKVMQRMAMAEADTGFQQEGLFEYHLYTLARPTDLLQNEQKQVTLLEAAGIRVAKQLEFRAPSHWFRSPQRQPPGRQKVSVYLEVDNTERNGLGQPLPKGVVRVYKADSSGAQQFVGEDRIDHTPRDESFRIKTGEAFDVVAERRQTDYRVIDECRSESAWRIEVRNAKDTAERVAVIESAGGQWQIVQSSHEATKQDATTFRFDVDVPARGATTIDYRVRVQWC